MAVTPGRRAGRPGAHVRPRLHGPARLARGLRPRRRLGRARPDVGPARGRGAPPARRDVAPAAAAAIEGVIDPCTVTMEHHNRVRRVHEDPRVTRPYGDAALERIHALGRSVDERLTAGDVPQRRARAAAPGGRRARRGRPVPGVGAALGAAPDDRGAVAAGVRPGRPLERPRRRRLHLPRRAPGRPLLRHVPGERERGRGPPRRPVHPYGHSPGPVDPSTWQPSFVEGGDGEYPRTLDPRRR